MTRRLLQIILLVSFAILAAGSASAIVENTTDLTSSQTRANAIPQGVGFNVSEPIILQNVTKKPVDQASGIEFYVNGSLVSAYSYVGNVATIGGYQINASDEFQILSTHLSGQKLGYNGAPSFPYDTGILTWLGRADTDGSSCCYTDFYYHVETVGFDLVPGPNSTNVTFQVSSDQIISPTYTVTLTAEDGSESYTYTNASGTTTTDIQDNTTKLWNITVNSTNHFYYIDNSVNLSGGAYDANITTTDSTITSAYRTTASPVTIGPTYATVQSFTFEPEAASEAFAMSQIQVNSSSASVAACRILVDGVDYDSETTRTLSSGSVGNLFISSADFNVSATNTTIEVQCRKTSGANYIVDNAATIIQRFYDSINSQNITNRHINGSGISVNTTWKSIYDWNFTTGDYNLSNNDNLHWLFIYRTSVTYAAEANLTLTLEVDGVADQCDNLTRYGTAGSTGSFGNGCYSQALKPNTTYNASIYASTSAGSALLDAAIGHTYEILSPVGAINSTITEDVPFNATWTALANVSITNPIGGTYRSQLFASVNARANTTSSTGRFYIANANGNTSTLTRTLSPSGNGNIVLLAEFNETGTGTRNYTLWGWCANDCVLGTTQLTAYHIDQSNITPNSFQVSAYDVYNGSALSTFNVTVRDATRTTTNGTVVIPTSQSLENITIQAENYFSNTSEVDTTIDTNASLVPWTAIYAVDIRDANSTITNFSVEYDGENYTTTTGTAYIPLYNETAEVTIDATGYALSSANLTASPYLQNYTFSVYTTNSVQFYVYDEETEQLITQNVTFEFISDVDTRNASTTNGTLYIDLLQPVNYTIRYSSDPPYQERLAFVTITNRSTQERDLYLINGSAANLENVSVIVIDQTGAPVEGYRVQVKKYFFADNAYLLVEEADSDVDGTVRVQMQLYEEFYRFTIQDTDGTVVKNTEPATIKKDELTIQINTEGETLEEFGRWNDITYSLAFNTSSNRFRAEYTAGSGLASNICFKAYRITVQGGRSLINSSCSTSSSATLLLGVTNTTGALYEAVLYATDPDTGNENVLDAVSYQYGEEIDTGTAGIFLQILLTLTAFGLTWRDPRFALIAAPLSLVVGRMLTLNAWPYTILFGLVLAGMIIAWGVGRR